MLIYLSLLVAVVGCLVYALASNGKVAEIGRIALFSGLLAFLLEAGRMVGAMTR